MSSDQIESRFELTAAKSHYLHPHYTLALIPLPTTNRLHRAMQQVDSTDDVGSTMHLVEDRKIEITATLGRHTNDHMVSFCMRTPSGFEAKTDETSPKSRTLLACGEA